MDNVSQIQQMLENMEVTLNSTSLVQDNKIIFTHNDKIYRVRMPKHRERVQAEDIRNKKEVELVSEGNNFYKEQLKEILLKNQNINIDEKELEKEDLRKKIKDVHLETAMTSSSNPERLVELKEEFDKLSNQMINISIYITEKLKTCIEDRVEKEAVEYLTSTCTEVLEDKSTESWVSNWVNYEHFKETDDDLTEKAVSKMAYLLINTKQ